MLQNATPLRKSAPWPPSISDEHVSCTAAARRNACLQMILKCPTPAIVFGNATKPSRLAHFWEGAPSHAPATLTTSERPKVVRTPGVFNILTLKCASRDNGVHFFDISTSKSGPRMVCFVHFDFEMCFAPKRRALFRHRNFQKWSGPSVLCTFWLRNVLRATTVCTFSTSQLPKVVRTWCVLYILTSQCASRQNGVHFLAAQLPKVIRTCDVLYILTWKCASRHNGVQFFIFHLARWLRTRRFSEPTFRPSGATILEKHSVLRLSYLFARLHLLSLTLSLFCSSLFYSSLLSDSSHLCISSVHIVGSLTSKLPSITGNIIEETPNYGRWTLAGFYVPWATVFSIQGGYCTPKSID